MKKLTLIASLAAFLTTISISDAGQIKVLLASESSVKSAAVQGVFEKQFPEDEIIVIASLSNSGVPEQPIGLSQAMQGVENRINSLPRDLRKSSDYIVAMENYIEQDPQTSSWNDVGLVQLEETKKTDIKINTLTKNVKIPSEFIQNAFEQSITVGEAVANAFHTNPNDWHREFGGMSRQELLSEALFKALNKSEIDRLRSLLLSYPDFPKPGILFQDFFPLLSNPEGFQIAIDLFYAYFNDKKIDIVLGLESRGFILGGALAYRLGAGFVPVRKPGKLPGAIFAVSYQKEYGSDTFVIAQNSIQPGQRVLIIDDLIATGGSAKAAIELVKIAGGIPVEFASLLEIRELEGRSKLGIPSFNLIDNQ